MRFDIEDLSLYDDAGEADFIDVFEFKNAEVIEVSSPEQSVQGRIAALTRHGGSVICPCLPVSRSSSSLLRNSHRMGFPTIWIITVLSRMPQVREGTFFLEGGRMGRGILEFFAKKVVALPLRGMD